VKVKTGEDVAIREMWLAWRAFNVSHLGATQLTEPQDITDGCALSKSAGITSSPGQCETADDRFDEVSVLARRLEGDLGGELAIRYDQF
jgi:hypothetical protein